MDGFLPDVPPFLSMLVANLDSPFLASNLFRIAFFLDKSDESGRKLLRSFFSDALDSALPDQLPMINSVLRQTSESDADFTQCEQCHSYAFLRIGFFFYESLSFLNLFFFGSNQNLKFYLKKTN